MTPDPDATHAELRRSIQSLSRDDPVRVIVEQLSPRPSTEEVLAAVRLVRNVEGVRP